MGSGGGWVGCSMLFPTNVSRRLMVTLNPPFVGNLARTQLLNQFSTSLLSSYLQVSQGAEGTAVLTYCLTSDSGVIAPHSPCSLQ